MAKVYRDELRREFRVDKVTSPAERQWNDKLLEYRHPQLRCFVVKSRAGGQRGEKMTPTNTPDDVLRSAEIIAEAMGDVQELATRAQTFYTSTVTTELIVEWLLQFREPRAVQLALKVLRFIDFIDRTKLSILLR